MKKDKLGLVSIVVPVYKVEEYLERCIDSLVNQTYDELEIVLVNDESPDDCGIICEKYALKDKRIKVIHKKNGGLSDARNYGIINSEGEYILFVDSDDYIELNAVEELLFYAKKEDLDIVCGNANRKVAFNDPAQTKTTKLVGGKKTDKIMMGQEYLVSCIINKSYSVAVWTRMYRTDLIKKNRMFFKKGLLHEDEEWTPRVLLAADRVGYINFTFYNYLIRNNSITQSKNKQKNICDIISTCEYLNNYFDKEVSNSFNKKVLKDYLAKLYINTCRIGEYNRGIYNKLVKKSFALRNSYFLKTRLECIVFSINISLYRFLKNIIS